MGCGCGRRAGSRLAGTSTSGTGQFQYAVTLPDGTETGPFMTPLEARREVRVAGGGTIRRVPAE